MRRELPPLSRRFVIGITLGTLAALALLLSLLWMMRAAGGAP
jgi:hypothetical protein